MPIRYIVTLFILLATTTAAVPALARWSDDWPNRKELTFDTSDKGAPLKNAVTDAPVLIRLHSGNFQSFFSLKDGGADLRFIGADDKTVLKHHVEKFDPINEIALIWVRAGKIAPGKPDGLWMYFGNANSPTADDPAGTYDENQALVYHFDGAAGAWKDATANGNHPAKTTAEVSSASLIGAGARFAGKQSLSVPASASLQFAPDKGWTWSAWIKIDGPQKDATLLEARDANTALILGVNGSSAYARAVIGGRNHDTTKAAPLSPGNWHHVALVALNNKVSLYLDGAEAATVEAPLVAANPGLTIGASARGGNNLTGELDEVQVSNVARSADWLKVQARGQGVNAALVSYGGDQGGSGGASSSYFGTILRSVTVDGWVVIVLLTIMAGISWAVMVGKGMLLKRVRTDNQEFLRRFQKITAGDMTVLDQEQSKADQAMQDSPLLMALFGKHDHFQSSSLYHLYHAGIQDIKTRTGHSVGAKQRGMSEHALSGVRAVLDAAMVREQQKLNEHMVLLTIAISGGPFLGLLGTVVGVMITFAAIAATGDVNINAIAPGISAALVATVAGLVVAIPALFGYNYLGSQLRDILADMRVFCDELISRIAEQYCD